MTTTIEAKLQEIQDDLEKRIKLIGYFKERIGKITTIMTWLSTTPGDFKRVNFRAVHPGSQNWNETEWLDLTDNENADLVALLGKVRDRLEREASSVKS